MKIFKILPFIALAILTLFNSCSKDDDSPSEPTVEDLILSGTWYYESQSNITLNDCDKQSNLRFFSNGNYLQEVYDNPEEECEMALAGAGTFELLSDETLTMTYDGNTLILPLSPLVKRNLF